MGDSEAFKRDSPSTSSDSFPASQPLVFSELPDWRCRSIRDAVKFAKSNNILGLMCEARLLVCLSALGFSYELDKGSSIDSEYQRERACFDYVRIGQ